MNLELINSITKQMEGISELTLEIPSHKFQEYFGSNWAIKNFINTMAGRYKLQITIKGDYYGNRTLKVVRE